VTKQFNLPTTVVISLETPFHWLSIDIHCHFHSVFTCAVFAKDEDG